MHPVFISYARKAGAGAARALRDALPGQCFLDEEDLEAGEIFPGHIVDALLGSRVVVLFASEAYFQRRYCLWELRAALGPYEAQPSAGQLGHIVVVLAGGRDIEALPPDIQKIDWPAAGELDDAVRLIRERLATSTSTLGERYAATGHPPGEVRARLLELTTRPPPADLSQVAVRHGLSQVSLHDDFVGRWDDLHRVDFWLRTLRGEPGTVAPIVTVEGLGGLGKTRLVAEYVHRFGPRHFRDGIVWIDATKAVEPQLHGALQSFAAGVPDLPVFQQQRRDAGAELARALRGRSVLWIVDNVPEPEPSSPPPPLATYCPVLGQVAAVMTSRRRLSMEPGRRGILLRELEPEAAVQLLSRNVSSAGQVPRSSWTELVSWVGGLPLALTLLNQVLLSGETVQALLQASKSQRATAVLDRRMEALRGEVEPGTLRGITEALSFSCERLSPASKGAAQVLAQLAPAPVPMAVLEALPEVFTLEVKRQLLGRSFVSSASDPHVPMFGAMHRVLADYLRGEGWLVACQALTQVLFEASLAKGDQWRLQDACLPHALHLLSLRSSSDLDVADPAAVLRILTSQALAEMGRFQEALAETERVVKTMEQLAELEPQLEPIFAMALTDLASKLRAVGLRKQALVTIRQAVSRYRRMPVMPGLLVAPMLECLSACCGDVGEIEESLQASMVAVAVYRSLVENNPFFRSELAIALARLAGHLVRAARGPEALPHAEEALRIARSLARERSAAFEQTLGTTLTTLGHVLLAIGRPAESLEPLLESGMLYRRLFLERERAFHLPLVDTLEKLAGALNHLKRDPEALEIAREILALERRPGAEGRGEQLARALNNLAVCLANVGRWGEAAEQSQDAVEAYARLADVSPGEFQTELAQSLTNLTLHLAECGRVDEALEGLERASELLLPLSRANRELYQRDWGRLMLVMERCAKSTDPAFLEKCSAVTRRLQERVRATFEQ